MAKQTPYSKSDAKQSPPTQLDEKQVPSGKYDPTSWIKKCKSPKNYTYLKRSVADQIVVYRENRDDAAFGRWLNNLKARMPDKKGKRKTLQIVNFCGACDKSLLLIIAKGIKTVITSDVARPANRSGGGGPVQDEGIYFASNLKVKFPKPKLRQRLKEACQPCKSSHGHADVPPVTVAVFDTGLIREEFGEFLIEPVFNPCIRQKSQGWNFIVPNDRFDDDHPLAHGSNVSRLIIDQCLKVQGAPPVKIIPVKVHDKNGNSDLYSVLCALAYAREQNVDIINASFGFYAPITKKRYPKNKKLLLQAYGVDLFKKFIKEQLTDHGILLVAAAGNKTTKAELKKHFGKNFPVPTNQRDLDKVNFYPASFASELPNVIAVTTVNRSGMKVSARQNFSANVIDVGVKADEPNNFGFINPRTTKGFLRGSSYAAPILTGVIAANFPGFKRPLSKSTIISTLLKQQKLEKRSDLVKQIKQGIVL